MTFNTTYSMQNDPCVEQNAAFVSNNHRPLRCRLGNQTRQALDVCAFSQWEGSQDKDKQHVPHSARHENSFPQGRSECFQAITHASTYAAVLCAGRNRFHRRPWDCRTIASRNAREQPHHAWKGQLTMTRHNYMA